jgi:DNA-binding FadR family transcriptional regulator
MHENQVLIVRERPEIKPRSIDFHRRLLGTIRDGQDERARQIMREHIADIEREMYSIIKDSSGAPGRRRP